ITNFCFKKYFLPLFLLIFTAGTAQKKFTIVLDAGHGDHDVGATRSYEFGTPREKDITLGIVLKLGRMLEDNKAFRVIYTRKTDVYPSLTERTNLANRSKADLFVSVHVNSSPAKSATARGTETFVQGPNQNRENLEVAKKENDVIYLDRSEEHTSELQSREKLVCRLLLEKKDSLPGVAAAYAAAPTGVPLAERAWRRLQEDAARINDAPIHPHRPSSQPTRPGAPRTPPPR